MQIYDLIIVFENYFLVKILDLLTYRFNSNQLRVISVTLILTLESFILNYFQIDEVLELIVPIITLVGYVQLYNKNTLINIFKVFAVFLNLTFIHMFVIISSTLFIGVQFNRLYNNYVLMFILTSICIFVQGIEYIILQNYLTEKDKLSGHSIIILSMCSIVTFVMTNIILREYVLASISFTFCMSLVIVFIFFLFLVVVLCVLNARYYEKNLEQSLQLESYQYEDKYINAITEKTLEYNKLNHDMKNHMNILKDLISDSHIEAAKNYMNELSIEQRHGYLHVNHLVLNYLLNDKIAQAEDNGIKLSCIIVGKPVTFISDVDYSILINNLLDNAIEGTLEAGDDEIYATFSFTENKCVIEVKNATIKKPKHKQLITSKKNKERHGIGLKNIKEVVDKYRGQDNIEVTERFFYHECILYKVD